jgi:hypothetical protein
VLHLAACSSAPAEPACLDVLPSAPGGAITLERLLSEFANPDELTALRPEVRSVRLASSYDRRAETGDWFANADWGNYQAIEGDRAVLLEADGPGVISRIWSANPAGNLRVFVDGAETPVIDADMGELLRGQTHGLPPELAFVGARGHNLYLPIAYQSHVKVTIDATQDRLYYHVTYRTYEPGTSVEPFSEEALDRALAITPVPVAPCTPEPMLREATLDTSGEGGTLELTAPSGGGLIRELTIDARGLDDATLRGTELTIDFDGEQTVRVPLGDFYGGGPGRVAFDSRTVAVTRDGQLISRWPMPFLSTARVGLRAASGAGVSLPITVAVEALPFTERSLLFHATWTPPTSIQVSDAEGQATPSDLRLVSITGRGVYAGTVLNVADPHASWWGEGDEKIFVDGEAHPSHFGTGTEDYFGWAWCSTERFMTELVGQTRANASNNGGYISAYRWLALDAIPFESQLVFDMEVLHWSTPPEAVEVIYDGLTYFYAEPGAAVEVDDAEDSDYVVPVLPEGSVDTGGGSTACG